MEEVSFLFDNQLIAAVENLIRTAKHKLILISPYIDLDPRIKDALTEKMQLHNFKLYILFGKNESNLYKSLKKESVEFFKQFPDVEIRYNERLHAKFYQNDSSYIMTSLNLYNYSLANNIEVGIKGEYASTGLIGKAFYASADLIGQGVDKVKQDVLGQDKVHGPIEKFKIIFEQSEIKYKTEPIAVKRSGLQGLVGLEKLDGFKVIEDKLEFHAPLNVGNNSFPKPDIILKSKLDVKLMSASQISKALGITSKDVTSFMQQKGLINGDAITVTGIAKGLVMKNYMGNDYIAYPENLAEFQELKR